MPLEDDIYLGTGSTGTGAAGYPVGAANVGVGPTGRIYVYDIVPLVLSATNLATSQSPGTSTAPLTLTKGTGITAATTNSQSVLRLDVPRNLRFTSGGNDTGITFNVAGYDQYGQAMSENVTGASGGVAAAVKAWYDIFSITPSGTTSTTITVGTGDVFGMPIAVPNKAYVSSVGWANELIKDTGTFTTAVVTTATATTGDVRGTFAPQANASDGARRLVVSILLSSAQAGSAATRAATLGVTQA
jgi:hypothetical protein